MANIRARLAHMGIYVQDRDSMERFYTEVLGLMVTDQGQGRAGMHLTFMSGNPENHHQLVLVTGRPDTSGFNPIQQMSFMVDSLADLREVHKRALELGATEMRPISHGNAWSIYFKDPEGNVVEAYLDTPFHVPQPHGKPLDLTKSDDQILSETEAACRDDPGEAGEGWGGGATNTQAPFPHYPTRGRALSHNNRSDRIISTGGIPPPKFNSARIPSIPSSSRNCTSRSATRSALPTTTLSRSTS
jgi:catechol 2,3-dioxygenase